jgi:hypothetical protein
VWHSNRAEKTSSGRSRSGPAPIVKRDPHRVGRSKRDSAAPVRRRSAHGTIRRGPSSTLSRPYQSTSR